MDIGIEGCCILLVGNSLAVGTVTIAAAAAVEVLDIDIAEIVVVGTQEKDSLTVAVLAIRNYN